MDNKKTDLSVEALISAGWVKTDDPVFVYEKVIENRNPINDNPEDSGIKLVLHGMYNSTTFAVLFPDGSMLNFIANSMRELAAFEDAINFYDPAY